MYPPRRWTLCIKKSMSYWADDGRKPGVENAQTSERCLDIRVLRPHRGVKIGARVASSQSSRMRCNFPLDHHDVNLSGTTLNILFTVFIGMIRICGPWGLCITSARSL